MPDKKKILIIEDEVILVQALKTYFEKDFEVISALDGLVGYSYVNEYHPDLILLDIFLPSMDGFDILKKVKEEAETKDIPVIILSNCGGENDVKKGLDIGATAYFVKADTELQDIQHKVQDILAVV